MLNTGEGNVYAFFLLERNVFLKPNGKNASFTCSYMPRHGVSRVAGRHHVPCTLVPLFVVVGPGPLACGVLPRLPTLLLEVNDVRPYAQMGSIDEVLRE